MYILFIGTLAGYIVHVLFIGRGHSIYIYKRDLLYEYIYIYVCVYMKRSGEPPMFMGCLGFFGYHQRKYFGVHVISTFTPQTAKRTRFKFCMCLTRMAGSLNSPHSRADEHARWEVFGSIW